MNSVIDIPSTITSYEGSISFKNKEEKCQLIESVADRISSIYAAFLTSDYHSKRVKNLSFFYFPNVFPDKEEVEKFNANLKNRIINELNKVDNAYVELFTEHAPEELLDKVLEESDISYNDYELYKLFPEKISTQIQIWNSLKKLKST